MSIMNRCTQVHKVRTDAGEEYSFSKPFLLLLSECLSLRVVVGLDFGFDLCNSSFDVGLGEVVRMLRSEAEELVFGRNVRLETLVVNRMVWVVLEARLLDFEELRSKSTFGARW